MNRRELFRSLIGAAMLPMIPAVARPVEAAPAVAGNTLLTPTLIAREAARILKQNLAFAQAYDIGKDANVWRAAGDVVQYGVRRRYVVAIEPPAGLDAKEHPDAVDEFLEEAAALMNEKLAA